MTYEEFKDTVKKGASQYPFDWRQGQKVFNYIDEYYGVARAVQFEDKIDCFYDDGEIPLFIEHAYNKLKENHII